MNFYKVTVKCYDAQHAYFYHHCILAARTRYEAMCHFMAAMALPNPPFVLGMVSTSTICLQESARSLTLRLFFAAMALSVSRYCHEFV